jgi:hypothetical protein
MKRYSTDDTTKPTGDRRANRNPPGLVDSRGNMFLSDNIPRQLYRMQTTVIMGLNSDSFELSQSSAERPPNIAIRKGF